MQKSIEKPVPELNKGTPKLPPVGTVFVVTKDRITRASAKVARTGFLCKTTKKTTLESTSLFSYYTYLDFNFKENEWIHEAGIWNWRCDELEEITLIQEDI